MLNAAAFNGQRSKAVLELSGSIYWAQRETNKIIHVDYTNNDASFLFQAGKKACKISLLFGGFFLHFSM